MGQPKMPHPLVQAAPKNTIQHIHHERCPTYAPHTEQGCTVDKANYDTPIRSLSPIALGWFSTLSEALCRFALFSGSQHW